MNEFYVYIITNIKHTTLYVGVTNDIYERTREYKNKEKKGFSEKYNLEKLVYYETYSDISVAIDREKQLKNWKREWKDELITKSNRNWTDLFNNFK